MTVRDAINALLSAPEFEALEERLRNRSVFHLLGVDTRELSHSAFLAWLIDPRESHGMGATPLRRLMLLAAAAASTSGSDVMLDATDIDGLDLDAVEVSPEHVVDDKRRIDVVVLDGSGEEIPLLVVEYKVDAAEGEDQTKDYAAWASKHPVAAAAGRLPLQVFLCPDRDDETTPAAPFVHVSYKAYLQWLASLRPSNERARFLVGEFISCLEQRNDARAPEIEVALAKLSAAHGQAIDVLTRASREDRESIAPVLRRHEVVLKLLGVTVASRRDFGGSALVAEGRDVASVTLSPERWSTSGGGVGSLKVTLRASVAADTALRGEGLLGATYGDSYPLALHAFLTRPVNGVAPLRLAIRGETDVPGWDLAELHDLRDKIAADLRSRLASGPLAEALGTKATIATLKVKAPGVRSGDEDTPTTASAARPWLMKAFEALRAVETDLELWCSKRLPELLREARRP
jgi:hypothetical protein